MDQNVNIHHTYIYTYTYIYICMALVGSSKQEPQTKDEMVKQIQTDGGRGAPWHGRPSV